MEIKDVLGLMLDFGILIITLLALVVAIISLSQKK